MRGGYVASIHSGYHPPPLTALKHALAQSSARFPRPPLTPDGGLLVSEGAFIAAEAGGIAGAPGIYSPAQVEAWKPVTAAVHAKGGYIFAQLWALGRTASPKLVPTVWGPSAGEYVANPKKPAPVKITQMTEADIDRFVASYAHAAKCAVEAGFDGVEIHGANGYVSKPQDAMAKGKGGGEEKRRGDDEDAEKRSGRGAREENGTDVGQG